MAKEPRSARRAAIALAFALTLLTGSSTSAAPDFAVSSEAELRAALARASSSASVSVRGAIELAAPLVLSSRGVRLRGASPDAALTLPESACASAITVSADALGSSIRDLRVALVAGAGRCASRLPAALAVDDGAGVTLSRLSVSGGVRLSGSNVSITWSDVSNENVGAQDGTCVYLPGGGNSSALTPSGLEVANNLIHDCRYDNRSIYDASAQGVLVGAQDGAAAPPPPNGGCVVGAVVRNNNISGVDEMGIRVSTDNLCANVLNSIRYNAVRDWGQANKSVGGDGTDSGCLYVYGHWYSPGNNFTANSCLSTNASWGQNGMHVRKSPHPPSRPPC